MRRNVGDLCHLHVLDTYPVYRQTPSVEEVPMDTHTRWSSCDNYVHRPSVLHLGVQKRIATEHSASATNMTRPMKICSYETRNVGFVDGRDTRFANEHITP